MPPSNTVYGARYKKGITGNLPGGALPTSGNPPQYPGQPPTMRRMKSGSVQGMDGRFQAGGLGFAWIGVDACGESIRTYGRQVEVNTRRAAVDMLVNAALQWMQVNAGWNDRTGDARQKLISRAIHDDQRNISRVWLGHGVHYGGHLEYGMGGYYKIIEPGIRWVASKMPEAIVRHAPRRI